MNFRNRTHQAVFNSMAKKLERRDNVKMAVLFLLTADGKLWNTAKHHIHRGKINLANIRLRNGMPRSYTLLCCAKDIALGTSYLTAHDLADTQLIPPKLLGIINDAISIRRYGIETMRKADWQRGER